MSSTSEPLALPAKPGLDRDIKVIALVSLAHFVSHVHLMLLPPIFGQVREAFGVSYTQLALALTAFNVASAALQTPAGFLVDRIGPIAVLRLDGDFYESTRFCLETLYDRVVPGGYVIIDDYGTFEGCRAAVHEFLDSRGLALHLHYGNPDIRYLIKPSGVVPGVSPDVSDMGHRAARRA